MILAVENCNGCSKTTPGYTATTSTSASSSATPFDITYGSGSASGTLAQDAVSIAGYTHPFVASFLLAQFAAETNALGATHLSPYSNQVFAACDTMNNILDGDISGILGMGWSSIASSGAVPLVSRRSSLSRPRCSC